MVWLHSDPELLNIRYYLFVDWNYDLIFWLSVRVLFLTLCTGLGELHNCKTLYRHLLINHEMTESYIYMKIYTTAASPSSFSGSSVR
jgi:hypothetical protein